MMHPSTQKLLDKIAEMTRKKKIQWQESDAGIDFPTEGYTVSLVGEPPAMLLSDKGGRVLEEVTAEDFAQTQTETGQSYAEVFADLMLEGGRQARGTEAAIDSVLAELDRDLEETVEAVEEEEAELADEGEEDPTGAEDPGDESGTVEVFSADSEPETLEEEPAEEVETGDEVEASFGTEDEIEASFGEDTDVSDEAEAEATYETEAETAFDSEDATEDEASFEDTVAEFDAETEEAVKSP